MTALKKVAAECERARKALASAEARRLEAIRKARAEGMTLRAIAKDVGLSFGRVRQLLNK